MSAKILGIDVGSVNICAAVAELGAGDEISIIAISSVESNGIKKGVITNIELAANSIKNAVDKALRTAGTGYDKVIVSISGRDIKDFDCEEFIKIQDREININQIERLMQSVDNKAKVDNGYETIHVLPYNFTLDNQDNIEDPLGMSGDRLEAQARFITAPKSAVINLCKAVEKAGFKVDNIVLSGYASAIATLNEDERNLGSVLIDMGGATCNLVVCSGNSIRCSKFLGVGSASITNDLSGALHIPISKAEEIRQNFSSLKREGINTIALPFMGDESEIKDVSIDQVMSIIFARVTETFAILSAMLDETNCIDLSKINIILTGGMSKLEGIKDIAQLSFDRAHIRIASPNCANMLDSNYKDPSYSCVIGLCLYGAGKFTPYEIDSQKKMRYKGEANLVAKEDRLNNAFENEVEDSLLINDNDNIKDVSFWTKFINYIKNLF